MNVIRQRPVLAYFVLAFGLTWMLAALMIARYEGAIEMTGAIHYVLAWGPAVAAVVVIGAIGGADGLRDLVGRLFKWQIKVLDWLLVLSPFGLLAVAALISTVIEGDTPDLAKLGEVDYLGDIGLLAALLVWIFSFGIGEEIGWRGFAQHYLEPERGLLATASLIGVIWACWHLPYFFYKDTFVEMGLIGFPFYLMNILPGAIVLGWLYSRTQSVLAVGLWHGFFDFGTASAIDDGTTPVVMSMIVIVWALWIIRQHGGMLIGGRKRQAVAQRSEP